MHVDTSKGWRGGQQQAFYLVRELKNRNIPTAMVCQPGSIMENACKKADVPVYPISMRGEWDLFAGRRLGRLSRQLGFSLLHAHCAHGVMLALWARLFFPGTQVLATRRVDFSIGSSPLKRLKYTNTPLSKIVCVSSAIKAILVTEGVQDSKLALVYSGVDLNRFDDADSGQATLLESVPKDKIIVGTVAALVGHKDYPTLLQAARTILDVRKDVVFCAVGEGEERATILSLVRQLGLGKHFIFTGFQENVGAYLKRFDIFVLASHMEGLGGSILEAMLCKLPIVATTVGGIPEIIEHPKSGLLVPPQNPKLMAQAILGLMNDRTMRKHMGQNARIHVERFSMEKMIKGNLEVYASLLKK